MLRFEEAEHKYYWDDSPVPSVTQMLAGMGMCSADGPWFKPEHRARGRAVHLACMYVAEGTFDADGTAPALHGYVRAYQQFLKETGFRPQYLEEMLYSPTLRVAGTFDQWGTAPSGETWLVDLKSGTIPKLVGLQVALYDYMLAEVRGWKSDKRKAVRLEESGKYTLVDCSGPVWTNRAMMVANLWHLKKEAGLIKGDDNYDDDRDD